MKKKIGLNDAIVIPNGVNFMMFKPMNKQEALKKTGFDPNKKNVIFIANNVDYSVKNYSLAREAIKLLNDDKLELIAVSGVEHSALVYYYNSADLLLLTSFFEGSSNVIKEAMACNCPVVSTDVGDVRDVLGKTKGCYVCSFDEKDVRKKILSAIMCDRTNGRDDISFLNDEIIAKKIISIYKTVITRLTILEN